MGLKLIGEVALDGSGFEKGLARLGSGAVGGFKNLLIQAFGVYGIEQAIARTVEIAGELVHASQRLGIGVEKLQLLKQAAKDAGSDLSTLVNGFEKIEKARAKALGGGAGSDATLKAFRSLGINKTQLNSMSREDMFMGPVAKSVHTMNQADLEGPMEEVFGKAFGELIPVLLTDFQVLKKHMERLGIIMDTKTAVALDLLGNEFSLLSKIIVVQLGPALLTFLETVYKCVAGLAAGWAWVKSFFGTGVATPEAKLSRLGASMASGFGGPSPEYYAEKKRLEQEIAKDKASAAEKGMTLDQYRKDQNGDPTENAKKAALETIEKWTKPLDELRKELSDQTERLNKPVVAKYVFPDESKSPARKLMVDRGDALLRVGNFLGSGGSVIEGIANRQLTVLQQIADNTRPSQGNGDTMSYPPV